MKTMKTLIYTFAALAMASSAIAYDGNSYYPMYDNNAYYPTYAADDCCPANPSPAQCCQPCDPCRVNCDQYCCDLGVEGWAEWLVWRVRKCDLDFAVPFDESDFIIGNTRAVEMDWNSGGRWGLFKNFDCFQVGAKYARITLKNHKNSIDENGNLAATRLGEDNQFTTNGAIEYAYGRYDISYDVVDAEAAYVKEECDGFGARLFGGFRYARIVQDYRTRYSSNSNDPQGTRTIPFTNIFISNFDGVTQHVEMVGYGIYLGGSGYKDLACGFGVFGKASVGALIGHFDRSYKHEGHGIGVSSFTTNTYLKDNCNRLVNNLELAAGFQYRMEGICGNDLVIKVGYEFSHWYNTQDFMMVFGGEDAAFDRHIDSLGFDGMTLKLEINL